MAINHSRRACILLVAAGVTGLSNYSIAQSYPSKQIRIVVPFTPGGGTDAIARAIAEKIAPRLGQSVIIENKSGAGGIIGTDAVAKSAPDGHTFVLGLTTNLLINQYLYSTSLPYNPQRDLAMVSQIGTAAAIMLVHPGIPANNVKELIAYIENNKGKVHYGSYGIGSQVHLIGAHMSQTLNAGMSHVPYRGEAPMLQDLIGGRIHIGFASALAAKPFMEMGRLKAIGITGEQRLTSLPNIPTLSEQGLKDDIYRITGWYAVAAPAGTPKAIVKRMSEEIQFAMQQPDVKARFVSLGGFPTGTTAEELEAIYARDAPVWEKAVKASGARLD